MRSRERMHRFFFSEIKLKYNFSEVRVNCEIIFVRESQYKLIVNFLLGRWDIILWVTDLLYSIKLQGNSLLC